MFLLFRDNVHLRKGVVLHLNKLESPSPKNGLCQVQLNLAQCFWKRLFNKNLFNVFKLHYLPLKVWPFIRTNMNSLYLWIEPSLVETGHWFWRMYFSLFYYVPFKKGKALYFNKLEFYLCNVFFLYHYYLPFSPKNVIILVETDRMVLEKECILTIWLK